MSKFKITAENVKAGMEKSIKNAEDIFEEGMLLKENGRISRAFYLFHMANEECAKASNLGYIFSRSAYEDISRIINSKELNSFLTSHDHKNSMVAQLEDFSEAERKALKNPNYDGLIEAYIKTTQKPYIKKINQLKNASIYVGIFNGKFKAPNEIITEEIMNNEMEKSKKYIHMTKFTINFQKQIVEKS